VFRTDRIRAHRVGRAAGARPCLLQRDPRRAPCVPRFPRQHEPSVRPSWRPRPRDIGRNVRPKRAGIPCGGVRSRGELVFTPRGGGPRHVVVLSSDCGAVNRAGCPADTRCVDVPAPELTVGGRALGFRFPPGSALRLEGSDDLTLSGPVTIAVSKVGDPLPCGLLRDSCASQRGVLACVDQLFAVDGTCDPTPHPPRSGVRAAAAGSRSPACRP
jgi:hypothetical protein